MDRLKVLPNERVDIEDFRAGTGDLVLADQLRQTGIFVLPAGRTTGLALTSARIVDGFTIASSYIGGTTAVLLRGSGFLPIYEDGETRYGLLLGTEDPASWSLDFSGVADGVYSVWVRAMAGDGAYENRVYWNPLGAPAREIVGNMATRRIQSWEACLQAVAAAPPGHGEWVNVWQVTRAGGVITVLTDYRHLFFEGSAPDTYAEEWGDGANDRNADRKLYGAKDLHMWGQLVRRQLANIIGVKHYTAIPRHLTDLSIEHKAGGNHGQVQADALTLTPTGLGGRQEIVDVSAAGFTGHHRVTTIQGHSARREFFDDFYYSGDTTDGYLHTLDSTPWGFIPIVGAFPANYGLIINEKGGVIRLNAANVANNGIEMIAGCCPSAGPLYRGWWDLAPADSIGYPIWMWRFRVPTTLTEMYLNMGLIDPVTGYYALCKFNPATGGKIQGQVKGAAAAGTAVDLVTLVQSTWYTIRAWVKNSTTVTFTVNGGAGIDAVVSVADALQSGDYDLYASVAVSATPAANRSLDIDQAFCGDAFLPADAF
jgi:hypothetical protein